MQDTKTLVVEVIREMSGLREYKKRSVNISEIVKLRNVEDYMLVKDSFFDRVEFFSRRNSFYTYNASQIEERVCLRCVRNFAMALALKEDLSPLVVEFLNQQFVDVKAHDPLCARIAMKEISADSSKLAPNF